MIWLLTHVVVGAALMGFTASAAPEPKEPENPNYFPTRVGAKWVVRTERMVDGRKTVELRTRFVTSSKDTEQGREVGVSGSETAASKTNYIPDTTYLVSDKGVFTTRLYRFKYEPPKCLIQTPVKVGAKWNWKEGDGPEHTMLVRVIEQIKVPAGTYKAAKIEYSVQVGGKTETVTHWFAADVGIVKTEGSNYSSVLESFTPGKP